MSFALPTVLALTQNRAARTAERTIQPAADASASLEARLAEALLGDAVLALDDMPAGWYEAEPAAESLFAKTQYASILLAGLRVAFGDETIRGVVDEEIAVLPRWMLRHPHEAMSEQEDTERRDHAGPATGTATAVATAVAVAPRIVVETAGSSVIRRGTIVMALRFEGALAADVIASITSAAEAKCEQIAEVLR
jgi:hypothetical protein